MANPLIIALGKTVQALAGLRGGGSSLPGLVVEKIDPDFAVRLLRKLPLSVVVISGTNGKTTTTKIVCDLLASAGLRVFTNDSGSNFMRGVISSLLRRVTLGGRLDADIAVLELDEAHAVSFAQRVQPRLSLLLNVMRDQLDRFGEIDHTADLLAEVARNTTQALVLNREDRRIASISRRHGVSAAVHWYGLSTQLTSCFPEDDDLWSKNAASSSSASAAGANTSTDQPIHHDQRKDEYPADVVLTALSKNCATYTIDGKDYQTKLTLKGVYNAFNAAAALALVRLILGDPENTAASPAATSRPQQDTPPRQNVASLDATPTAPAAANLTTSPTDSQLLAALSSVASAFGRGEEFLVDQTPVELLLVKNPGGFRLALESFDASNCITMIAINDEYADGRDMSWLYDVSFQSLAQSGVALVSGLRAYDMALRLYYDQVAFGAVQPDLHEALAAFLTKNPERPHRIYCTYTAMLALRRQMGTLVKVDRAL